MLVLMIDNTHSALLKLCCVELAPILRLYFNNSFVLPIHFTLLHSKVDKITLFALKIPFLNFAGKIPSQQPEFNIFPLIIRIKCAFLPIFYVFCIQNTGQSNYPKITPQNELPENYPLDV